MLGRAAIKFLVFKIILNYLNLGFQHYMSVQRSLSILDSKVWMIMSIWKPDFHFLLGFQIKLFFVMSNSDLLAYINNRVRKSYESPQVLKLHHCEEISFATTQEFCASLLSAGVGITHFSLPQRTSERVKGFNPWDISGMGAIKVTSVAGGTLGESHDWGWLCSSLSGAGRLCWGQTPQMGTNSANHTMPIFCQWAC